MVPPRPDSNVSQTLIHKTVTPLSVLALLNGTNVFTNGTYKSGTLGRFYGDALFFKKKPSAFKNNAIYFEVGPEYTFDKRMDPDQTKLHLYNPKKKIPKKFNPRLLDLHYMSRGEKLSASVVTKPLVYSFEKKNVEPATTEAVSKQKRRINPLVLNGFRVIGPYWGENMDIAL